MIRHLLRTLLALAFLLPAAACAADTLDTWAGTYRYEFFVGTNAGKVPILYTLDVQKSGRATLKGEGYQTDDQLLGDAKLDGNTLRVLFRSYSNGSTKNQFDVELYKRGIELVALTRRGNQLVTIWGAYNTDAPKPREGAVQFQVQELK